MIGSTDHRALAVSLFNRVWELMELPERSADEDEEMLHAAHASRYHWSVAGTARNMAIGDWQVSRVYALLGRAEPALYHGERSLRRSEANALDAFVIGYAHEALARAYLLAHDEVAARRHLDLALRHAEAIVEDDDRNLLMADLATIKLSPPGTDQGVV